VNKNGTQCGRKLSRYILGRYPVICLKGV